MPERMRVLVGLQCSNGDNFDFGEPVFVLEAEGDWHCGGIVLLAGADDKPRDAARVRNLNGFRFEPGCKIDGINARQHERAGDEDDVFFIHKIISTSAARRASVLQDAKTDSMVMKITGREKIAR